MPTDQAVCESKELGVWGSFEKVPGECVSRLRHLLGLPDGFNLLDNALDRRLTSASRWESEMIQAWSQNLKVFTASPFKLD